MALARGGGPEAVVLRERPAAPRVVPTPPIAISRVATISWMPLRDAALAALAQAIDREIARIDMRLSPHDLAHAHLRAVGIGYLDFAGTEPGLFRAAFTATAKPMDPEASRGPEGLDPFRHLGAALDRMVAVGLLPRERRPGAEYLAWSTVHGFAMLLNEGPLRRLAEQERRAIGDRLLAMVERGL